MGEAIQALTWLIMAWLLWRSFKSDTRRRKRLARMDNDWQEDFRCKLQQAGIIRHEVLSEIRTPRKQQSRDISLILVDQRGLYWFYYHPPVPADTAGTLKSISQERALLAIGSKGRIMA